MKISELEELSIRRDKVFSTSVTFKVAMGAFIFGGASDLNISKVESFPIP